MVHSRVSISLALLCSFFVFPRSVRGQTDDTPSPKTDPKPWKFTRIHDRSDEDLRKELLRVPEVGLDQPTVSLLYEPIKKATDLKALPPDIGPNFLNSVAARLRRPELMALPWRAGPDSQIGKEAAERMHVMSTQLRRLIRESVPTGDVRPDVEKLKEFLQAGNKSSTSPIKPEEWTKLEALPTLTQMLQAEGTPLRLLLVDMLAGIKGKQATVALVQRALFDLAPQVRENAVKALAGRPDAEVRPLLMDGLRYPWPAAAEHAAEAIVALQMKSAVHDLVGLLKEQDPSMPFPVEEKGKTIHAVREVVRVNHLCNCLVCHAPSLSKEDLVRGRVPSPGEDPPPTYYESTTGLFARAEITFLRQDFSVVQPVPIPGKWAGNQRYDYLQRVRRATPQEVKQYQKVKLENALLQTTPQRTAVLFALRQVTQSDLGATFQDWEPLLRKQESKGESKK